MASLSNTPSRTASAFSLSRAGANLGGALAALAPRERRAVLLAAWLLGMVLLWWLALAPALATLRHAPERHARLDTQLSEMRRMAATADALRAAAPPSAPQRDEVLRTLELAGSVLGTSAQLSVLGDRATVTLKDTPPEALAQWLAQVRVNARLTPLQANLTRSTPAGGWSGTLVLAGPGLGPGG
jgi:general secretion pathway protein M